MLAQLCSFMLQPQGVPGTQLVQLQTALSQQMNKPAILLEPLGSALRQTATQKKLVTSIQKRFHKKLLESLTTSLHRLCSPPVPIRATDRCPPHATQQ